MATLTERMMGAAQLDVKTYEEIEADTTATGQAMIVVVVASIAAGIGYMRVLGLGGVVWMTVMALVGWFLWAGVTFLIGTKIMPEPQTNATFDQLLRTIGFASAPGVLRFLGIIPFLGGLINFVIGIWMLIAMVIAVRQALDYTSTGKAVIVCLIGFVIYMCVMFVVAVPAFFISRF